MFRCPYCNTEMAHPEPEHLPMSHKRREIFDYIAKAGPQGAAKKAVIDRFFSACESETVLRTTIHYLNKTIAPIRISNHGGILRLVRPD